jgi:rhizosphere induced protein
MFDRARRSTGIRRSWSVGALLLLATGLVPVVSAPAAEAAAPPARRQVIFENLGNYTGGVVLYQVPPAGSPWGTVPLAWQTASTGPNLTRFFRWTESYGVSVGVAPVLSPRNRYQQMQTVPANPNSGSSNRFLLGGGQGPLRLRPANGPGRPGTLTVSAAGNVPQSGFAVGVTMSGSTVYADQAQPNLTDTFPIGVPQYYLALATVPPGTVLNPGTLYPRIRLVFPPNVTTLVVVLQYDGVFVVTSP